MDASTLFVILCIFTCSHVIHGNDTVPPVHPDVSEYLQNLQNHVTRVEQRLEDQNSRLLVQERTVQDLTTRLLRQERSMEELREQMEAERRDFLDETAEDGSSHAVNDATGSSSSQKRSDDAGPLVQPALDLLTHEVSQLTSDVQALSSCCHQRNQSNTGGSTYIRWGYPTCTHSSERVYSGIVSGSNHTSTGGGGGLLCLTNDPVFDKHVSSHHHLHGHSTIHGSEYSTCPEHSCYGTPVCAVCRSPRATSVMIPGTNVCASGWTKEYSGYIMAGSTTQTGPSEYICVDSNHGRVDSTHKTVDNENLLYYTFSICGALPCPPYVDSGVVTCVVCTK